MLAGCSLRFCSRPCWRPAEAAEGKGGVTPTVSGPVTINVWHTMTASNQDTLKSLVDRFNSSQNEVRVNLVYQGTPDECLTKVLAVLGTSDVPAVVQLLDIHTRLMVDSGEIVPVQDFIDRENYDLSDFEPRAVEYYTLEGKLQSMPFNVSTNILIYDKNAFRDAGLDPEKPPATLDEVRQYSEKLLRRDGAGNVVRSGIALDVGPWYLENMLVMHGDLYANNENGREGRGDGGRLQPGGREGVLPLVARHDKGQPGHQHGAQSHRRRQPPRRRGRASGHDHQQLLRPPLRH